MTKFLKFFIVFCFISFSSQLFAGTYVLDCDGKSGTAPTVLHGYGYPTVAGELLGKFFIQTWLMPRDTSSRYWFSVGYGAGHEILAGFTAGTGNNVRPSLFTS